MVSSTFSLPFHIDDCEKVSHHVSIARYSDISWRPTGAASWLHTSIMATVFPPSRSPLDEERATEKATEHNTDQRHDPQSANHHDGHAFKQQVDSLTSMWNRFNGKGKRKVGLLESLKAIALSSCKSPFNVTSLSLTCRWKWQTWIYFFYLFLSLGLLILSSGRSVSRLGVCILLTKVVMFMFLVFSSSMLLVHHSSGKTVRLGWWADGYIFGYELGGSVDCHVEQVSTFLASASWTLVIHDLLQCCGSDTCYYIAAQMPVSWFINLSLNHEHSWVW